MSLLLQAVVAGLYSSRLVLPSIVVEGMSAMRVAVALQVVESEVELVEVVVQVAAKVKKAAVGEWMVMVMMVAAVMSKKYAAEALVVVAIVVDIVVAVAVLLR